MINTRQRDLLCASGLALGAFGLYASLLSKAYVFEGLLRAMPIETGRWVHLFSGNYLLYGPLAWVFHTLLQGAGIYQPAVVSLQVLDALLGGAGVFVFYFLLRHLGGDALDSSLWSVVLACSLGYWLWSTDAENYILSTVLLLINFFFLVRYAHGDLRNPVFLGALHGLAILGHIVNAVFGGVVLWVLYKAHGKAWRRPAGRYIGTVVLGVVGIYAAVLLWIQKPASAHDAFIWLAGSAGSAGGGSIYWGGGFTLQKFWDWLKMSLHIWLSFAPPYTAPPPWPWAKSFLSAAAFLLAIFITVVAIRLRELYRKAPVVVGGCLVWLAAYACVFTRWQPYTMVYRVSDLGPFCLLLFLGYRSIQVNRRFWKVAAAGLAFCLAIGNGAAELMPRSAASNNPDLERMAFLKANTQEGNWIMGDGHDEIYIPYFAERRPIVVQRFAQQPERLSELIDSLLAGKQTIFVTSRVLSAGPWKVLLSRYRLTLKAKAGDLVLYRVTS